jgi:hypothetical protein
MQVEAHKKNRFLMKPRSGMQIIPLKVISQKRMANIILWVQTFETYENLTISVEEMLNHLQFGVKPDRFEHALDELGRALGFSSERPDKQWKEGPDNLWAVQDDHYLIIECKNDVDLDRKEIVKDETGQMNNACAWFSKYYKGAASTRIEIIPTNKIGRAAGFNEEVGIMRKKELTKLTRNVKAFFSEFKTIDFKSISEAKIQELVNAHGLSVEEILNQYSEKSRP